MTPAPTEAEMAATIRARYPGDALIAQAAFGSPRRWLFAPRGCPACAGEPEPGWIETDDNGPIVPCGLCTPDRH